MQRINKYIALLQAGIGDDCKTRDILLEELISYQNYVHAEAGIDVIPEFKGWSALSEYDYRKYEVEYEKLIPCTQDKESFETQRSNVDIFSIESIRQFENCTGKSFSNRRPPGETPEYYFEYEEPSFDEENLNQYYE